jgi:TonB-dependent Receptor Plug Domain
MSRRGRIKSDFCFAGRTHTCAIGLLVVSLLGTNANSQTAGPTRPVSGVVMTEQGEVVPKVTVTAESSGGTVQTVTDSDGNFHMRAPLSALRLKVSVKYVVAQEKTLGVSEISEGLVLSIRYTIPIVHENLIISAIALNPTIDQRNDTVYKDTLFSRDDQLMDTLAAGINTGQHEGGGKSLEIRRFGFNLDHGGVNGGLKVLVNDVQQNQGTQGHGQGYLGALKSLTPELIDDADILNGPFSAEYGDFSGLGDSMPPSSRLQPRRSKRCRLTPWPEDFARDRWNRRHTVFAAGG